ncbi:MAG TPA: hypothetical protein VEI94_08505 [Candidatus Bathyarchaeia archaeon]|nr:hypothetical protein [Candidatus Bathyarchaeia archaeon]
MPVTASFTAYLLVFLVIVWSWLPLATHAIPVVLNGGDAQLIVWVLAWVAHAAVTPGVRIFDANIHYPAPAQLTASDYFFTSQVIFAPVFWLTGNAVVAANVTLFLAYPLAALVMERLLRRLGTGREVAWVGGLCFALAPTQAMNIQVLQYPSLFLPLTALALVRLRDCPSVRRAAILCLCLAAGAFSALYMAVMVGLVGLIWGLIELVRRGRGRLRFALMANAGAALAFVTLALVLTPYRSSAVYRDASAPDAQGAAVAGWLAAVDPFFTMTVLRFRELVLASDSSTLGFALWHALQLVGLATVVLRAFAVRLGAARLAVPGIAIFLVAMDLTVGFPRQVEIVFPALGFFRFVHRFVIMASFGQALLVAAGLQALQKLVAGEQHRTRFRLLLGVVTAVLLFWLAAEFRSFRVLEITAQGTNAALYDRVGQVLREAGGGPLLELPLKGRSGPLQPDAMIGSTRHWQPLVVGYSGYPPDHFMLVVRTIQRLPASDALADLVDMTHLRWILLRPEADWQSALDRQQVLDGLLRGGMARRRWAQGEWVLLELTREAQHPEWFAAIASGTASGTVLGTPLTPVPRAAAIARVSGGPLPASVSAGAWLQPRLRVENAGTAAWPVAAPPEGLVTGSIVAGRVPEKGTVRIVADWAPLDPSPVLDRTTLFPLFRDVSPGEVVWRTIALQAPSVPGLYRLTLGVKQIDGAQFDDARSSPLAATVKVLGPEPEP